MGWPPKKLEPLTSTYITSPIKSEPACAPSISSSPATLQNWGTHVIWKTISTPNWPPINWGKPKWSDNGSSFLAKFGVPSQFLGSLYFPSIMWFPISSQVKQNPNFIEGHPFKDIQGPVRLRRHRFFPCEALVAGKKAGKNNLPYWKMNQSIWVGSTWIILDLNMCSCLFILSFPPCALRMLERSDPAASHGFMKKNTTGFQFYSYLQCAPCQGLNFIEPHNLLKRGVPIL